MEAALGTVEEQVIPRGFPGPQEPTPLAHLDDAHDQDRDLAEPPETKDDDLEDTEEFDTATFLELRFISTAHDPKDAWQHAHALIQSAEAKGFTLLAGGVQDADA